jgi:hypothetical protein
VALEASGQTTVALAVLRELASDVGPHYLDVDERIAKLESERYWGASQTESSAA